MEETFAINRRLSAVTLISPPLLLSQGDSLHASSLPILPFDLVEEILARLPVKFLLQLRCVCKSWNSLISDNPKFAKKHLRLSTNRRHLHTVSLSENTPIKYILMSYPINSTFTTTTSNVTQLDYPPNNYDGEFPFNTSDPMVGSCDGILCLAGDDEENFVILWNPSIRKLKELPPLEKPDVSSHRRTSYGFGYDSLSDNYKVVVVIYYLIRDSSGNWIHETQVMVHTLGTDFWRKIQEFPSVPVDQPGKFVSGKLNWLTFTGGIKRKSRCIIVSLDLGNESYQEVLQPDDYGEAVDVRNLILGVLNDCLCLLSCHGVWVMKEYGNKESWTKMFCLPYLKDYALTKAIYIFEDDQVLLGAFGDIDGDLVSYMVVYDSRNGIVKFHRTDNTPEVSVESLISP